MKKELNLYTLITTTFVRQWRVLVLVGLLASIVAVGYMFSLPRYYTSVVKVVPETTKRNSLPGGLGDMAAIAGISMNSVLGDEAINPDIYPDIFKANDFLIDVLSIGVMTSDSNRVSYYEYIMKHQPQPWWGVWFADSVPSRLPSIDIKHLTRQQENLLKNVQNDIQCFIDKKTGMIDLRVTAYDAQVAATLADSIMTKLQAYIIDYRTSKVRTDLAYSEQTAKQAKEDYDKAQKEYVSYADSHQDVVLSEHQRRITELENEMELQYQQYNQLQQQKITLQAKLQERTPAFTIIQSASVPARPAGPKRMFGVIGIVAFALFSTFAVQLVRAVKQWNRTAEVATVKATNEEEVKDDEA